MALPSRPADHQVSAAVVALSALGFAHAALPQYRPTTQKFFSLSFHDPVTDRYSRGWDDLYFVALWVVIFTGLRAGVIDCILRPLATLGGIRKRSQVDRFAEQAWLVLYYSASWSLGMYTIYNSPYWLNLTNLWVDFPTHSMEKSVKWYYLVEFGFWIQQFVVIHVEKRRKDHWQMLSHHIFTCCLLFFSYGFYQTNVGTLILTLMDVVDIVLSLAKILKYLGYQTACDAMFALFVVTWFVTRHILYPIVCWSIWRDTPRVINYGCFNARTGQRLPFTNSTTEESLAVSPNGRAILPNLVHAFVDPAGKTPVCFSSTIAYSFLFLLGSLQVLIVAWFVLIVKLSIKVIRGANADDTRSDEEDEVEVEDETAVDDKTVKGRTGLEKSQLLLLAGADDHDGIGPDRVDSKAPTHDGYSSDEAVEEPGVEQSQLQQQRQHVVPSASSPTTAPSTSTSTWAFAALAHSARQTGIALPVPGDRNYRELLGRIGCDKPPGEHRKREEKEREKENEKDG